MKIKNTVSISNRNKMTRVEQNSMPISLHYALTDSQCSICGGQLEWQADFDNINQPKYTSQHCNQNYAIHIDTVKVEILGKNASKGKQEHEQEKSFRSTKRDDEPKALQMAEAMKRQQQQEEKNKSK
jgi:hypothetical protein